MEICKNKNLAKFILTFCCNIRLAIDNYKDHFWKHSKDLIDSHSLRIPCPKCIQSFSNLKG